MQTITDKHVAEVFGNSEITYNPQINHIRTIEQNLITVNEDGLKLKFIQKQTQAMQMAAVKQNGLALQYCNTQTIELCLKAIHKTSAAFQFIYSHIESSPCFHELAVEQNPWCLLWIQHNKNVKNIALKAINDSYCGKAYQACTYLHNAEFNLAAVRANPRALRWITIQTKELCYEAINRDYTMFKHATFQPEDLYEFIYSKDPAFFKQKTRVRNNAFYMTMMKNSPEYWCFIMIDNHYENNMLAALTINANTFKYMRMPTLAVINRALELDELNIMHVIRPTEEQQLIVVQKNPAALQYIQNPSFAVCKVAVAVDHKVIDYIDNETMAQFINSQDQRFDLIGANKIKLLETIIASDLSKDQKMKIIETFFTSVS